MLSTIHLISLVGALGAVTLLGIYSRRRVKSAADFIIGGRRIGPVLVAGTITGTLVGGASTIGTAQLAFYYGFSAWWFTLGGGLGCLVLGLFLARPLRASGAATGPGFLARAYGPRAGLLATIFSSVGIFLNIVGQILSAVALLSSMLPLSPQAAAFVAVLVMILYVIFGGVWSTGLVGLLKISLLYLAMAAAGGLAYHLAGGWRGYRAAFDPYPWFSLVGRGVGPDLAAGFSLVVGVVSTQTYLQAIFAGRDARASRQGALISALIIPPIGLAGIAVGLYMQATAPDINAREALPLFVIEQLPAWFAGIVLATLFVSTIGTGAGLGLGISAMFTEDIYKKLLRPAASDQQLLWVSRAAILAVMLLGLAFVAGNLDSLILEWSFLSMGLRGATICLPLLGAVFLGRHLSRRAGVLAVGLAPFSAIVWAIFGSPAVDPLYVGLSVSLLVLAVGATFFNLSN